MDTNEFLEKHKKLIYFRDGELGTRELAPEMKCADGFTMSVQVSHTHYCTPKEDDAGAYSTVEVSCAHESLLEPYDVGDVYGHVPVEVVDEIIAKHGGIVEAVR